MAKFKVGDKVVTDHGKEVYEVIEVKEGKYPQYKLSGISGWWSEWQLVEAETNMSIKDKKGAYEFKNSNLRFHGMKMDINGNPCFVLSTPNQRAFSVQQPYSITIHWSTNNGNSKESGIEIVEKNTKGNPFKSEEEFESYVLDLAKGRKHVKVYGNNFACGKGNFDLFGSLRQTDYYETGKGRLLFSMVFDSNNKEIELYTIENGKKNIICRAKNRNNMPILIPMSDYRAYVKVDSKLEKDFEKFVRSCDGFSNFSIIDDTKDVLRAGGKLAGNVVKDTLYNGGILMF